MDNISFKSIVQMYLRNKIIFIVVMIVAFALGLIVAYGTPKIYESSNTKVRPKGLKKDITYFEFLQDYQKQGWWAKVLGGLFKKKEDKKINPHKINPQALTQDESTLIEGIKGQILCTIDKENELIDIKAYAQDAITNYRTNKSRDDLAYYQKLKQEAYQRYVKAQRK